MIYRGIDRDHLLVRQRTDPRAELGPALTVTMPYRNPIVEILQLMIAHGEEIDSRIRFQKSVFLLKHIGIADFAKFRFSYHHFGPYSHQLSDVLQDLVGAGLISEVKSKYSEEQVKYTYRLTEAGKAWLSANQVEPAHDLNKHAALLKGIHWRTLELASTVLFLLDEENVSDSDSCFALFKGSQATSLGLDAAPT